MNKKLKELKEKKKLIQSEIDSDYITKVTLVNILEEVEGKNIAKYKYKRKNKYRAYTVWYEKS